MQASGAIAVAVGDPEHQSGWITMYAPGKKKKKRIGSIHVVNFFFHR
jgi:hypothetical protein